MGRPRKPRSDSDPDSRALSRERIVEVGLQLISANGLDGFSLRDVARELGVYPAAIHWHVRSKNALLGEICTLVMSKAVPPRGSGSWQDWLKRLLRQYRSTMRKHPYIAQLVGARLQSNSERNTEMIERILQVLQEAGCPEEDLVRFYNTIVASMCGFVTLEFAPVPDDDTEEWRAEVEGRIHRISALRYPVLARHLPRLVNNSFILRWQNGTERPMDSSFETYLEVFIGGLEASIERARIAASTR